MDSPEIFSQKISGEEKENAQAELFLVGLGIGSAQIEIGSHQAGNQEEGVREEDDPEGVSLVAERPEEGHSPVDGQILQQMENDPQGAESQEALVILVRAKKVKKGSVEKNQERSCPEVMGDGFMVAAVRSDAKEKGERVEIWGQAGDQCRGE